MGTLEITLCIVIGMLIGALFLVTVQFSRTLQSALVHADQIHARNQEHIGNLVDRLMAMDFATYKAYAMAEDQPVGGFVEPEPEIARPWVPPEERPEDDE